MVILNLLTWWYGVGWRRQVILLKERLAKTSDYFSIDLLLRTLFAPFRQLSAGKVDGPIGVKIRAFFDRLISRIIGGIVRLTMIGIGGVTIGFQALLGVIRLVGWAVVPVVPIIGLILSIAGWMPWIN